MPKIKDRFFGIFLGYHQWGLDEGAAWQQSAKLKLYFRPVLILIQIFPLVFHGDLH